MTDIERWRKQLEKTLDETNSEIGVLNEAKESCERALEAKALPHDVVTQCLSIREGRREYEVVRDPVEASLNNENHLIDKIRSQLKVFLLHYYKQICTHGGKEYKTGFFLQICKQQITRRKKGGGLLKLFATLCIFCKNVSPWILNALILFINSLNTQTKKASSIKILRLFCSL